MSAGRPEGSVQLLPVSKTRSEDVLLQAMQNGLSCFGENYVSEALTKQRALKALCSDDQFAGIEWHFIGPVQSNKTRQIAEHFSWVQSLDRLKIARRLNEQRPPHLPPINVCIQVNIDHEDTKAGIDPADLFDFHDELSALAAIRVRGLMAIPAANQRPDDTKRSFQTLYRYYQDLANRNSGIDTLSMGMSGDLELAIECGSTMVRVGTALFGARN